MTVPAPLAEEFRTAARQAIGVSGAESALESMGWWDLLPGFDDAEQRMAAFAFLRAQGTTLASSVALGGLLAQPFLATTDFAAGEVISTVRRGSGETAAHMVVGDPLGRRLLIDEPGRGAVIVDVADVELDPIPITGRLTLSQVRRVPDAALLAIPEPVAESVRGRSVFLGRLGIAAEILGAAERAMEMAVEYVGVRQQFGKPIGTFQAIRHLLGWGQTECVAIGAVLGQAIRLDVDAPPQFGAITKALAGRNGRRVCERTLQSLGGIGFTAEHDHHHLHSRVIALDALLGSSADLTHELGADARGSQTHSSLPSASFIDAV